MTKQPGGITVDLDARTISVIDGERVDEWRLAQVRRASEHYGRSWVVVFDDAAAAVARAPIGPTTARVLIWATAALDPRDWRAVQQADLAASIGVDRTSVSRALTDLVARGIIVRRGRALRLSIWWAWCGTARAYRAERTRRRGELEAAAAWHAAHHEQPAAAVASLPKGAAL